MEWIKCSDRLPDDELLKMTTHIDGDGERLYDFDCLDGDSDEPRWYFHANDYEHYLAVACEGMTGPSEEAAYTHWCAIEPPEDK